MGRRNRNKRTLTICEYALGDMNHSAWRELPFLFIGDRAQQ